MNDPSQRGFPYDSTLPLLAAFVAAVTFLGLIAVYASSAKQDPAARAAATTTQTTTEPTETTPAAPPLRVTLTVTSAGDGRGEVSIDEDASRDCSDECRETYERDTSVTLVARPAPGSKFVGWTGSCGNTRRCTVTLDRERSLIALFALRAPPAAPSGSCNDGIDDDGDALTDGEDPDCIAGDSEDPGALDEPPPPPDPIQPPAPVIAPPPPVVLPPPPPEEPPALPPA